MGSLGFVGFLYGEFSKPGSLLRSGTPLKRTLERDSIVFPFWGYLLGSLI